MNIVLSSYDSGLTTDSVSVCDISLNAKEIQESANNGTFTDLQKKIDDAPAGSIISLEKDYIYDSGFSANGITINKELTINGNGYTIDALGQSRIFNTTSAITLDNIIFKNGKVNGAWYGGGAVRAYGCSIDIMNSMFIGNSAYYGGAISGNGVSVKNCIFKDNKADGSGVQQCCGGAIYSFADDVKVDNSTFIGNYAHDYGGAIYGKSVQTNSKCYFINNTVADNDGGAIYTENVYIVDSTFEGNSAYVSGGAIYNVNGITVKNSTFKNNKVEGATINECEGGAIYTRAPGDIKVDNCTFIGNHAYDNGGALAGYGSFYVSSSTFIGNDVSDNCGGAIYAEFLGTDPSRNYVINVIDSIFDSNSAYEDGGAIYTSLLNAYVKNSTFKNNKAEGASVYQCYGGAIASHKKTTTYSGTYTLKLDNSTFIGNHAYDYGGAISADTITWVNTPSYFINNYVNDNQGGAIYTNKFNTDVSNAVFIGNEAKANDDGGAIYINNANTVTFSHCTFKDNKCGDEGGAIYLDSTSSVLTLKDHNSFVNNHAGDEGHDVFNKGYYGTISGNWWGTSSPDFNNGQLIEWKHWPYSNIKHKDSNPLQSAPDEYVPTLNTNGFVHGPVSQFETTLNEDYITEVYKTGSQYQETFYDAQHNVLANELISFDINNVTYYRTTDKNGVASLNIRLTPGIYSIKSKNPVTGEIVYKKIKVDSNIIDNNDLIKYYKNSSQFEVTILGENGNAVGAGKTVTFNVNGVTYTRTTDANGKAALNINLGPGDYTITTEYNGVKDLNKIKVLPVLSAEDLTKKVGSSDQFVAKLLDGQGKALTGETVTFNINGVYYQSISDSEGYAKLNIDLIPGEYIITSSYNGSNVANKITITG
jgi:predicted outer membrane repeat protein